MVRLVIRAPESLAGQAREIGGGPMVLGRAPDVDWPIDDLFVSRRHAIVRPGAGYDEIVDAGSTSGTYVNGQLVRAGHPLRDGDVIRLAQVELVYIAAG
jgi:pSer/pThr/pTyr-binding forkhead associated (FHA) protein